MSRKYSESVRVIRENNMKIIISPAKKMRNDIDCPEPQGLPVFIERTEELLARLRSMSQEELKKLWACNDSICNLNCERLSEMDLKRNLSAALVSYDGIQYQYMAPQVFEEPYYMYVQEHLRILSGFYGILKPLDGVTPYRLEMQARLATERGKNLYAFWGDSLYNELTRGKEGTVILNLASDEYSKCIERYLKTRDRYITCIFGQFEKGKITEKGVYVKMARGEMVRYLAERRAEEPEEAKNFDRLGYSYREELSDDLNYVFLK